MVLATDATQTSTRSQYVDTLRAIAIVRVYLHHALWIGWLTVIFPSMFVMFALAGFLVASSLERGGVARTLWSRIRRLLPPLWGLAAVAVPLMLAQGWTGLKWTDLVYWFIPLANPVTNAVSGYFALALWYLRAYLWFVLLAPLIWWAFRRWPIVTLVAPMVVAVIIHSPLVRLPSGNRMTDVLTSTAFYGTAWVLGYARHTGLIDRCSWKMCGTIAAGLGTAALAWGVTASTLENPISRMFWGTGFVLVLMRLRPNMTWLHRLPPLSRLIGVINARAVTIYVWHLPVLFAAGTVVSRFGRDPLTDATGRTMAITLGTCLLCLTVMAFGWLEDLAARRRPALIPARRAPARQLETTAA